MPSSRPEAFLRRARRSRNRIALHFSPPTTRGVRSWPSPPGLYRWSPAEVRWIAGTSPAMTTEGRSRRSRYCQCEDWRVRSFECASTAPLRHSIAKPIGKGERFGYQPFTASFSFEPWEALHDSIYDRFPVWHRPTLGPCQPRLSTGQARGHAARGFLSSFPSADPTGPTGSLSRPVSFVPFIALFEEPVAGERCRTAK